MANRKPSTMPTNMTAASRGAAINEVVESMAPFIALGVPRKGRFPPLVDWRLYYSSADD